MNPPAIPHVHTATSPARQPLHYRITSVRVAPEGVNKVVNLDWFLTREGEEGEPLIEVKLLQDQIAVDARATDEEILEAVERRRGQVGPTFDWRVPNPEENAGLIGHEG